MVDKKNIVSTMVEQHRNLLKEVTTLSDLLKSNETPSAEEILKGLNQFQQDLAKHLKLENGVFYVELLKDMKAKGQDTIKTQQFIDEMKGIEKVVYAFLEKFSDAKSIEGNPEGFKKEFAGIGEALALRIESEEAGVFSYWVLF